jgi:pimeloyl-ACP methyl ester carboxylesterase
VVLLLHGGGQTRHSWSGTAQSIAAQGWTAVSVDARGHGDSDWAPDGDYSIDALIADLAAVVAAVTPAGGERPVLVGASMGGMTALIGQGERGDLARALVLVDIVPTAERGRSQADHGFHDRTPGRVRFTGRGRRGGPGV